MSDEECLKTATPSLLRKKSEHYLDRLLLLERALYVALKIIQMHETRKSPEEHPEYQDRKDELEILKEELKK